VTYTTGARVGYNIKTRTSSDYLLLSGTADGGAGSTVQTGGVVGTTAELWNMAAVAGAGFTFQSAGHGSTAGTGMYMRNNAGTLVADQLAAGADTFTMVDCSGTGSNGPPQLYNRVGFVDTTGANPWWRTNASTPYTPIAFTGAFVCDPTNGSSNDAYYLYPGIDVLTVTDSAGNVGTCSANVEQPVQVFPPIIGVPSTSTAIPAVQTWGGSAVYASCTVTTNASMSVGGCHVAGPNYNAGCSDTGSGAASWCGGEIVYTTGTTTGTDVLKITDSDGNTGTLTVVVGSTVVNVGFTTNTAGPLAPKSTTVLSTGTTGVTWTFVSNNSGGTLNAATGVYVAGSTGNVSDVVSVTNGTQTGTVVIQIGPPITVTPSQPNAQLGGTIAFTATGGTGSGYTWSVTGGGTINASTGAYTAGTTAGTSVVKVVDTLGNQATVSVVVSCGADASLQILYPYTKTVFPLGMLPPLIQWKDNGTSSYAKVTLQYPTTGTPSFVWSEIVQENGPLASPYNLLPTALKVTGGGRAQIPQLVWTTLQTAAATSGALISVQTLEANQGTIPTSITVHFASAPLTGTIYYQSYDTNLVTHGAANPVGAILGIKIGSATPTLLDPSSTAGTTCRACHSVSASGNTMLVNDCIQGGAPCTTAPATAPANPDGLYGGSDMVALPGGTESPVPPGLSSGASYLASPNDGRFTWPALSPDGSMIFTTEGNQPVWLSGQWYAKNVAQLPSGLYSVSTGMALSTTGLPPGFQAKFPSFATDTSAIAFNYASGALTGTDGGATTATGAGVGDDVSLAMMNFSPTTRTFSSLQVLFTPPASPSGYPPNSGAAEWPSFMPAVQNGAPVHGVVFQNRVVYNCNEPGADNAAGSNNLANGTGEMQHNIGALGELWWVNTDGNVPVPVRLATANGSGYLPLGPNGHGVASTTVPSCTGVNLLTSPACATANPSDSAGGIPTQTQLSNACTAAGGTCAAGSCQAEVLSAMGNGDDTQMNFKPTVNPQVTGGYQWVVFASRRMYGNVATINPWASNPRTTTEIRSGASPQYPEPKKLWVAAMNTNPATGSDPSYPPFYLEGQELYAGNSRSYWVLPQCIAAASATACTSSQDCCQTAPTSCVLDVPIATNPPTRHCVLNSAMTCSADGAACNVDSDCCTVTTEGTRCASGTCQVPPQPGYPASETITYDFQGCSPSGSTGTATVWEFIQTDQIIPAGTSITISAQTAAGQTDGGDPSAALSAATPSTPYTLTSTVSAPMFSTDVNTIDYTLRHPASGAAQASQTWLRVTVTLNASSNRQSAPTLISLVPTFDCTAAE
jgi:hypothetical protein